MKALTIHNFPESDYPVAEALNTLCANLTFTGEHIRCVMLTSCQATEGKSFLSMNILRTMARLGKTVALVDADLRRSAIITQYGITFNAPHPLGLAHYLAGMCKPEDILYATNIPGASIVPAGRLVTNPLSLLSTDSFSALLAALRRQVDFVIVDAPPVGIIIDAAEIAGSCDGVLFSVAYNQVTRRELLSAKRQIEKTGARILGTVLNNVDFASYTSRKYYNKSYYAHYASDYYKPLKRRPM